MEKLSRRIPCLRRGLAAAACLFAAAIAPGCSDDDAGVSEARDGSSAASVTDTIALPPNGGFEDAAGSGGRPAGWYVDPEVESKGEIGIVKGPPAIEGHQALRLAPNASNMPGPRPLGIGVLLPAEAFAGRRVSVSAALAGRGGATAAIGLAALSADAGVRDQITLRAAEGPPMVRRMASFEAPLPADVETLVLFLVAEGQSGEAFFDDLHVMPAPDAADAGAVEEGRETPVAIRIDADKALRTVPRTLFGTNVEWIRNAQGLWNAREGRLDPEVLGLAEAAGITLVRFPGGVWSDAYDWREGVGSPPGERAATPHVPGDRETSRHVVGTDEIAEFAERIGAHLVLTVNAGNGTPEMAASWARYIKEELPPRLRPEAPQDAAHGASPVVFWEIGNELYMAGDLSGGAKKPEEYAGIVHAFARAIREVDPDARIGAVGLQNYGSYRFNSHEDWNEVVLRRTGDVIDFFAVHNAYAPVLPGDPGVGPEAVYRALFAAPELIAANLETTSEQIRRYVPPERADAIEIAVTEWGPLFATDPASPYFDHVKTLGSALFAARTLNVFLRSERTTAANFFKLTDLLNMGWIGLSGGRAPGTSRENRNWAETPALMAFGLYARRLGDRLLHLEVHGAPTFESPPVGYVGRVRGAPLLDVVAGRDGASESAPVTLIAVNTSFNETIRAEIAVDGTGTGTGQEYYRLDAITLRGLGADAHVGTGMIEVPGLHFAEQVSLPPAQAFERGGPGAVWFERENRESPVPSHFAYAFPPLSVTSLVLTPTVDSSGPR